MTQHLGLLIVFVDITVSVNSRTSAPTELYQDGDEGYNLQENPSNSKQNMLQGGYL